MRSLMHHLDLTVQDLGRSTPFYSAVLSFLGYRLTRDDETGLDWDLKLPHGVCSIGIKPARSERAHDRFATTWIVCTPHCSKSARQYWTRPPSIRSTAPAIMPSSSPIPTP